MTAEQKRAAEALIPDFRFARLLNQDQAGRRISLLGSINDQPAILLAERAAFSIEQDHLRSFIRSVAQVENLGANDIYSWFLAHSSNAPSRDTVTSPPSDLKLNLIYPCTQKHVAKYSAQGVRMVTETPEIYVKFVRPYMQAMREAGRLNWVFNIIEGRTEQEDVILREHSSPATLDASQDNSPANEYTTETGFLLLPDLNWDRKTLTSLHLLGLVERRDIWSVRDLKPVHIPWLRDMRRKLIDSTTKLYPSIQEDQLKLYVHYQPTYYHFHVHVVHVMLEAGATQATGKALGLDGIIEQLQSLDERGMEGVNLSFTLGEESDLWKEVFGPLKKGEKCL